jgi:hypothetical protein
MLDLYSSQRVWTVRALEKIHIKPLIFLLIISVLIVNSNRRFLFWDEEAKEIVDVLPKDPKQIPTLYRVSDTETYYLLDDSMVVGVVVDGAPKAYPLMILDRHEVVNDRIGETSIIVSYCPLTNSPLVFTRPKQTTFGVSGKLFRNNLVLYDNVSDTLWSQIYMRGIHGEQKGTHLDYHPCYMMRWGEWKKLHPETLLIALPDNFSEEEYMEDSYAEYRASPEPGVFPLKYQDFSRDQKEMMLVVTMGDETKAYPYSALQSEKVISDTFGGQRIVVTWFSGSAQAFKAGERLFVFDEGSWMRTGTGENWDILTGAMNGSSIKLEPATCIPLYWFACKDFYPETQVFTLNP